MATIATVPTAAAPAHTARVRLDSIDFLRGLVMVLMALDHVRDYYTNIRINPMDVTQTWAALYFTRWITHFCAPVFVFLAGTGAYLYGSRPGRTKADLSRFLWTRGLWLVFIEMTVIRLSFGFNWSKQWLFAQVIWAIGWSMVLLAAAIRLPVRTVGAIGLGIIALHNTISGIPAATFGPLSGLWTILFSIGLVNLGGGVSVFVAYAVIPWFGVLAAGYAFGQIFTLEPQRRRLILRRLGASMIAAFVVIRAINTYGDGAPWAVQKTALQTLMSFLNCTKYPPSLDYVLMTLGPAILLLGFLPDALPSLARPFVLFGRVPMFYYLLHLPLLHAGAAILAISKFGTAPWMFTGIPNTIPGTEAPAGWGYGLGTVYIFWAALVLLLYPLCVWFAGVKRRRHDAWLSYL